MKRRKSPQGGSSARGLDALSVEFFDGFPVVETIFEVACFSTAVVVGAQPLPDGTSVTFAGCGAESTRARS